MLVKKNFLEKLQNNFYYTEDNKLIVFQKGKLDTLPPSFHLLRNRIDFFFFNMTLKIKQIKKYISLINIRNKIINESIKKLYVDDFE